MNTNAFSVRLLIVAAAAAAAVGIIFLCSAPGAEETEGFHSLYNGKDLAGWKTKGNWLAQEGGVLAIEPREGETGWKRYDAYLWAEKQYGDFILDLEYRHPPKGNSGIFVRVGDLADPVSTGIEVQILDSFGKEEPLTHHDLGGVIKTTGPSKNMSKPAGEWNRMTVTCQGSRLKVKLNGEQIVDIDLAATDAKDKPLKGYLGLQDHGVPLWFRNIRIKEL